MLIKDKYESKNFWLIKDWIHLAMRSVGLCDTTVIPFCSYASQVVNMPNTKLKRNGNQNCPLASAPANPPQGHIAPQLLLYLGTSCIYSQNYSMGWGSAANPAVLAAQLGNRGAQCHTTSLPSGLVLPRLILMLPCSRPCTLSPNILQKVDCLVCITF